MHNFRERFRVLRVPKVDPRILQHKQPELRGDLIHFCWSSDIGTNTTGIADRFEGYMDEKIIPHFTVGRLSNLGRQDFPVRRYNFE